MTGKLRPARGAHTGPWCRPARGVGGGSVAVGGARPARVVGTELKNPDFCAYAKAFGGFGVTVEKTADFPKAFKAAQASAYWCEFI